MKEYLTFDSVGGGSLVISEAGKYLLQLEDIIAVDGLIGGGGDIFSIWSKTPSDSPSSTCCYYNFEVSGSTKAALDAFLKAIEAKPGGRSTHVLLPSGTSITSWSFANEGIY